MPDPSAQPPSGPAPVFGTVAWFDADRRAGSVLLDDGRELAFDAPAFALSGLQHLRLGQRVRLALDDAGRCASVTLSTFPVPGSDPRATGLGRP